MASSIGFIPSYRAAPPRFADPEVERQFLREYRSTALKWAMHASTFGAGMFACFLAVAWLLEGSTAITLAVRIVLVTGLLGVAAALRSGRFITVENYVPVAACIVGGVLALTTVVPVLNLQDGVPQALEASHAIMIGSFVLYAFLRLPVPLAVVIGTSSGCAAIVLSPLLSVGSEMMRTVVYVVAANALGGFITYLIESRERELFLRRREAESARLIANERQVRAEEADHQKTRLIAAVSHDLRQPMTAAFAYIDVLRNRLSRDDLVGARAPAEKVQSALTMLGATLDHLLTVARYDSGTEALDIKLVDLRPLLNDLYAAYIPEAEKRGVTLKVRLPRQMPLLTTDARSIHRVLGNLISNAIKFTDRCEKRGGVLVAVRFRGDRCRIDVFDTGIGIAVESKAEIWKPYVQLNNVERDRERGLGLGLFLVKRIIEQLAGHEIRMDSRFGRGSRFTVMIPASRLDPPSLIPVLPMPPSAMLGLTLLAGASVLVVEDDRDARLSIVELLEDWQVEATSAATMTEVLSRHGDSERIVDAIICDYRLSGGANGIDAIAWIREQLGYAPHAVLITGEPDIAPLRARAGPQTTVLQKPFAPEALARPLLEAVRAARELEREG